MEKKKSHTLDAKTFRNHKIFIGGLQGSGKTVCARFLMEKFDRPVAVRMTSDFDDIKHLTLVDGGSNPKQSTIELLEGIVADGKKVENKEKKVPFFDAVFIDEADLIFMGNHDIPPIVQNLIAMHRHYKVAIILITRRPQDIPAKIVESCKYRFFYVIEGTNVRKYIGNINSRIPEMLDELDYDEHRFIYHEIGKEPEIMEKVPLV